MPDAADPRDSVRPRRRWLLPVVGLVLAPVAALAGWRVTAALLPGAPTQAAVPAIAAAALPAASSDRFDGFSGSTVRFVEGAEAQGVLGAADDWIAASSEMQRASLMGVAGAAATPEAFRRFQAAQVVPWSDATRQRYRLALEQVAPAFNRLGLRLPPEVLLVQSSGRESAATPHTRGRAVVLPLRFDQQSFADAELVAHELWHVVSRYQPELRTRVYRTLGFVPTAPLEWPAAWRAMRIANQDAPHHEHLMWVEVSGRLTALMPVVVADPAELRAGGSVVSAAQTRLLEVIPGSKGTPTRPVLRGREPVWHDPDATPAYLQKLGGNSDYLVHPEETTADNVMFLVSGRKVPNPALLERVAAAFAGR